MMGQVAFSVADKPVAQGSKRIVPTKAGMRLIETRDRQLQAWRKHVATKATMAMGSRAPLRDAVEVTMHFSIQRPKAHYVNGNRQRGVLRDSAPFSCPTKPDLDKLQRAVLDAVTGIIVEDDCQVVVIHASKTYAHEPGLLFTARETG